MILKKSAMKRIGQLFTKEGVAWNIRISEHFPRNIIATLLGTHPCINERNTYPLSTVSKHHLRKRDPRFSTQSG